MRLCIGEWMKFIAAYKGTFGYDYSIGDRQRPRMTTEEVRQHVSSLLSCDNGDWERSGYDDAEESVSDDDVAADDKMHA
jgi:hypothetical protein